MMGHNICVKGVNGKLSLNYPFYPFLSVALVMIKSFNPKIILHNATGVLELCSTSSDPTL